MSNELIKTIISEDSYLRNRSIKLLLNEKGKSELIQFADSIEEFRLSSKNLYHKVRASLFLFVIYRFYLQYHNDISSYGEIPFDGIKAGFDRDFERAIQIYLASVRSNGTYNGAVCSAIADSYYKLSFRYLLEQVKSSISTCTENYHLYNISCLDHYPFSADEEMTMPDKVTGLYPIGCDTSPVRVDPSHSGWSDIFFLGMDFPEGARVVNISVNLRLHGSDDPILPPCECYCRYIEEPVIHLISVDLQSEKKVSTMSELFNFGNDYLSLLKAGVVASGIVPPCFERGDISLKDLLCKLLKKQGGIQVVTKVNNVPKGSRLAVSTTLLSTIITRLMRFSGQIRNQTGFLDEVDRRIVASRAILGEWLGGSGGGWQDSGGLWPGIKIITGQLAGENHHEYGISKGCLLPEHNVFSREDLPPEVEKKILDSIVLVHGGISQDVGPILEMVTEKYLLKYQKEWKARLQGIKLFDEIIDALKSGNMKELGRLTTQDWEEAIQPLIPWVNNAFTEDLINTARKEFGEHYWGFLMLGGMSGGGMAFIVDPDIKDEFKKSISTIMHNLKETYRHSLPFIINPVVYDFEINYDGIVSIVLKGDEAKIPEITAQIKREEESVSVYDQDAEEIKKEYGFDGLSHKHMQEMLKEGKIGLSKNRLSLSSVIENVREDEMLHFDNESNQTSTANGNGEMREYYKSGSNALKNNELAVVTFAGGMGSRWTKGSAIVKPINPFMKVEGKFRTFLEIHLGKSKKSCQMFGVPIQHVFTTSYLTHNAIKRYLKNFKYFEYKNNLYLSPARTIGHRVYPMERDLRFYWKEVLQQKMDDNLQKVKDSQHDALIAWAKSKGEGEDYNENRPQLRFNPPGHWYEIPNLLKNGILGKMMQDNPALNYLFCHNIDTLGACVEPSILGMHIQSDACLSFEVIPRRIEDAGGGLAKVDGRVRLIEGLSLPREEDEYNLSYYNTLTNWIEIDSLLDFFELDREIIIKSGKDRDLQNKILNSIREIEKRIPTYVTIKNVKYLWGKGQEDMYPVAQFEKLWGDMTGLRDLSVNYISVSRFRGQQLKEPALLDQWVNDGSFDYVKERCIF